jgi:hypothetical protein
VTTAALGLAGFIRSRGGAACYAALNLNRHLESIAEDYSFDAEEDYYTCGGIDFYESMNPRHDYNFIVSDFGSVYNGEISREAVKGFKDCEARLLCGASGRRHEVMEFAEALKAVRSAKPQILTYAVNPGLYEFFCAAVTPEPLIMEPVRDMMDFKANALRFKSVIEAYIVETSRRL